MSRFDVARKFFEACETPLGWEGCQTFVAEGAKFSAQSEPLIEVTTVEGYCEWMKAFGTITAPGATYELHTASYDEATNQACFFATYHARHTGDGGPVPPTNKETHSHYVYVIQMNALGLVSHVTKIWNAPWAMRELGWS